MYSLGWLLWPDSAYDSSVGDITLMVRWDVMVVDWSESVGAIDFLLLGLACISPVSLAEVAKLVLA